MLAQNAETASEAGEKGGMGGGGERIDCDDFLQPSYISVQQITQKKIGGKGDDRKGNQGKRRKKKTGTTKERAG